MKKSREVIKLRIIGGQYRGRKLTEFPGEAIRPTGDRVKESLFNIISLRIYGSRVLDLFSGSGALGLECLSRGAQEVVFNDSASTSIDLLKKNIKLLKPEEKSYRVYTMDYMQCLNGQRGKFDIIFIDPPYRFDFGVPAMEVIAVKKLLTPNGVIVYERDRQFKEQAPEGLELFDERKYGKTYLSFFRWKSAEEGEEE